MPKARVDQDPVVKNMLFEVGAEIITRLKGDFFECDGASTATVKYADGTFKKKPILATWQFSPQYAYVGSLGKLILGFSPEDAQEYDFMEVNQNEIDSLFPLFGAEVAKLFGVEGENFKLVLDEIVVKRLNEKAESEKKAREEAEANYAANPIFGAF